MIANSQLEVSSWSRLRGYFVFEAGQFEDDEAVHDGGEDDHEADQHELQAGDLPHLHSEKILGLSAAAECLTASLYSSTVI